jgi:hypothetical protein
MARILKPIFYWLAFGGGFATALTGVVLGYASAQHYGAILRAWALYTFAAAIMFIVAATLGRGWRRYVPVILLAIMALAGVSPVLRLATLGWTALG